MIWFGILWKSHSHFYFLPEQIWELVPRSLLWNTLHLFFFPGLLWPSSFHLIGTSVIDSPHSQARFNRVSAGGRRRRGRQRMRWLDGITDSMDVSVNSGSWWWTGRPGVLQFMGSQRVGNDWATEQKWTEQIHWTSHHIRTCCPGMGKVQGFSRFHKPKLNYL